MLVARIVLEQDDIVRARISETLCTIQEQELRLLTLGAMFTTDHREDMDDPAEVWKSMARLFLGCSSLGLDVMLEEYGKKRLKIKRAEARELVP